MPIHDNTSRKKLVVESVAVRCFHHTDIPRKPKLTKVKSKQAFKFMAAFS